jgi:ribosomal protein S18 acetylase RimI-like enzyme
MTATLFRIATHTDVDAIVSLVNKTYRGPEAIGNWTHESDYVTGPRTNAAQIAGLIGKPESQMVVYHRGGMIDGCANIQRHGDVAYFGMFAVRSALQNGGVGKALLAECERLAVALWGARAMEMTVINLRTELLAFYERRGYRFTGRRKPFPEEDKPRALRHDYDLMYLEKDLTHLNGTP